MSRNARQHGAVRSTRAWIKAQSRSQTLLRSLVITAAVAVLVWAAVPIGAVRAGAALLLLTVGLWIVAVLRWRR